MHTNHLIFDMTIKSFCSKPIHLATQTMVHCRLKDASHKLDASHPQAAWPKHINCSQPFSASNHCLRPAHILNWDKLFTSDCQWSVRSSSVVHVKMFFRRTVLSDWRYQVKRGSSISLILYLYLHQFIESPMNLHWISNESREFLSNIYMNYCSFIASSSTQVQHKIP